MKIIAWILLIAIFAAPFLAVAWYLFPILAGICVWALIKFHRAKYVGKFLQPALLVLLLAFVVWIGFVARHHSPKPSYEDSISANAIRKVLPRSVQTSSESQQVELARQLFADEIQQVRLWIVDVHGALDLYIKAELVLGEQQRVGSGEDTGLSGAESGLSSALDGLQKKLRSHQETDGSTTPDLLISGNLGHLVDGANSALDKLKTEGDNPGLTAEEINGKREQIPAAIEGFEIEPLSRQIGTVENALRLDLKANISAASTYSFKYDRRADALTCEQITRFILADQKPESIDLTGFRTGAISPAREEIAVKEDARQEEEVKPDVNVWQLHPATKTLTLIRRVIESKASYPLVTDRVWIPFKGLILRWPIPLSSSVILTVRLPQHANLELPLSLPIKTSPTDMITAAFVPSSSFFYADAPLVPVLPVESDAQEEKLRPDTGAPTIADLASGSEIHLQLLPGYLSFSAIQKYKSFLFIENVAMAILLAVIACGWACITW